jgi:hypothetical protein
LISLIAKHVSIPRYASRKRIDIDNAHDIGEKRGYGDDGRMLTGEYASKYFSLQSTAHLVKDDRS